MRGSAMDAHKHETTTRGFIRLQIVPFQEQGHEFARCPEMNLVARGTSGPAAIVNLLNMVTASLAVASMRGNLDAVLAGTGLEVVPALPEEEPPPSNGLHWFVPLLTDARPRTAG